MLLRSDMMMKLEKKVGERGSLHDTMWLLAGVFYVEVKLRLVVSVISVVFM